jgi:hypothetical protein
MGARGVIISPGTYHEGAYSSWPSLIQLLSLLLGVSATSSGRETMTGPV